MKDVLFIISGLNRGGAEIQLLRLISLLGDRYRIHVLSLLGGGELEHDLKRIGARVSVLNVRHPLHLLRCLVREARMAKRVRYICVISFMYHANIFAKIVRPLWRLDKLYVSIRTEAYKNSIREWIDRVTMNNATGVVFNSVRVMKRFIDRGVVAQSKAHYIPNGFLTDRWPKSKEKGIGDRAHVFKWVAVGRLHPAKNYPLLLNAFHEVLKVSPDQHLTIVGSGPLHDELSALVKVLGISQSVLFAGQVDDVAPYLQRADGYVLTSDWEGFPNALIEACLCGLPCVSTNVGGVSELIHHADTGLIVEPGDLDGLVSAMLNMVRMDPYQRRALGEKAMGIACEEFSIDKALKLWEALIDGHN